MGAKKGRRLVISPKDIWIRCRYQLKRYEAHRPEIVVAFLENW